MAITTRPVRQRAGDIAQLPNDGYTLTATLQAYRLRIGRDRRRGFLGVALPLMAATWVVIALCYYLNFTPAYLLPLGVGLTAVLPFLALAAELATRPSLVKTARLLDSRLDNQQRLVTALELASRPQVGPLDATQIATTTHYLARFDPKKLSPERSVRPSMLLGAGLFLFAVALLALKGTGAGFVPYQAQALPDMPQDTLAALVSPTAASGLPGAELTPSPTASAQIAADQPSTLATPGAQGDASTQTGSSNSKNAADSQSAKSNLQKLGDALNGQSAAQSAADELRAGNYGLASKDLSNLGAQSDQLSDNAKKGLADALDKAASDTANDDNLRYNEQSAADALRSGDYKNIQDTMQSLGSAVNDAAGKVMTQQELAQTYPAPTAPTTVAGASQPQQQNGSALSQQPGDSSKQASKQDGGQGSKGGQSGQSGQGSSNQSPQQGGDQSSQNSASGSKQSGQSGQGGGKAGQGDQSDQSGQGDQGSQGGQSGQNGEDNQAGGQGNGQSGQSGQQGGQSVGGGQDQQGQGQSGAPGRGHRESGPVGSNMQGGGQNPFQLDGQTPQQPNRPGDPNTPPALTLDSAGSAANNAPVTPGSAGNTPGENSRVPVERWEVIQKYFSGK